MCVCVPISFPTQVVQKLSKSDQGLAKKRLPQLLAKGLDGKQLLFDQTCSGLKNSFPTGLDVAPSATKNTLLQIKMGNLPRDDELNALVIPT